MSYLNGNNQFLNESYDDETIIESYDDESLDDESFDDESLDDESFDDESMNVTQTIKRFAPNLNRSSQTIKAGVGKAVSRLAGLSGFKLSPGQVLRGIVKTNTGNAAVTLPANIANSKQLQELAAYMKKTFSEQAKSIADIGTSVKKLNDENVKLSKVEANVMRTINERVKELKATTDGLKTQNMLGLLIKPSIEKLKIKGPNMDPSREQDYSITETKFKDNNMMLMMMAMSGGLGGSSNSSDSFLPLVLLMGNSGSSGSNDMMIPMMLMLSMQNNKK